MNKNGVREDYDVRNKGPPHTLSFSLYARHQRQQMVYKEEGINLLSLKRNTKEFLEIHWLVVYVALWKQYVLSNLQNRWWESFSLYNCWWLDLVYWLIYTMDENSVMWSERWLHNVRRLCKRIENTESYVENKFMGTVFKLMVFLLFI